MQCFTNGTWTWVLTNLCHNLGTHLTRGTRWPGYQFPGNIRQHLTSPSWEEVAGGGHEAGRSSRLSFVASISLEIVALHTLTYIPIRKSVVSIIGQINFVMLRSFRIRLIKSIHCWNFLIFRLFVRIRLVVRLRILHILLGVMWRRISSGMLLGVSENSIEEIYSTNENHHVVHLAYYVVAGLRVIEELIACEIRQVRRGKKCADGYLSRKLR